MDITFKVVPGNQLTASSLPVPSPDKGGGLVLGLTTPPREIRLLFRNNTLVKQMRKNKVLR